MKGRQRLIGLGVASAGGALAHAVHMPLAWVLGSMLGAGLWSLWRNHTLPQPSSWRRTAQGVIGVGLGLYFTPEVLGQLGTLAPWVLVGALTALALSVLAAPLLQRLAGVDGPTAIYAVALGASAEMSLQGQRAGADAAAVASAHALRIMLVTTSATALAWALGQPLGWTPVGVAELPLEVWPPLLAVAALVALALNRIRVPNPWLLGPLVVGVVWAVWGSAGRLPDALPVGAQVLIGWALGQYLTRSFFQRAPRWLLHSGLVTLGILAACLATAWLISWASGLPVMTTFIAMAPGGMAEMGVIAKAFGLGAPVVTAFHLLRIVLTIFFTRWLAQWMLSSGWVKAQPPPALKRRD